MQRDPVIIIEEIETPLSSIGLFRLFKKEYFPFFLDSGMDPALPIKEPHGSFGLRRTGTQKLGRFSFLGFDPFLVFSSKGELSRIISGGVIKEIRGTNPFYVLKELLNRYKTEPPDTHLPFTSGAVGYFSYEMRHHIEKVPSAAKDYIDIPDALLGFYDTVVIIDHLKDKTYVASCGFSEPDRAKSAARARKKIEKIKGKIKEAGIIKRERAAHRPCGREESRANSNFTKEGYIRAIKGAKEYIASGDIYQVNLSQRFSCRVGFPPAELFERLRSISPAPFAAYLDFGEVAVVSASPERFLSKRGRSVHTRPIKGTRPRGSNPVDDERLREELLASAKDRAEHVMIVDLERNDLGRICGYGTVLPTEFVILEPYSTVFHLTSTVSGILREEIDAVDCLLNCFPGGSITGAPKIRSMEIIDSLEPTKRSIYTGSIGYIDFNGNMDSSIVIRTLIIKDGMAYFQVGGGIVADSDPEMEYKETLDKAKALMDALAIGGQANRALIHHCEE